MTKKLESYGFFKLTCLLAIFGFALVSPESRANKPLVDPAPIVVPEGLDVAKVKKAIRDGGSRRNWIVSGDEPGKMELTLSVRSHVLKVLVTYDTESVQVQYLDSTNLDYEVKKGVPHIHKKYMGWVNQNLVGDISKELASEAAP